MWTPTPGVRLIANALVSLLSPVALAVVLKHYILPRVLGDTNANLTWLIPTSFFAFPLYGSIKIIFAETSRKRRAAALGARLPPKAIGKWPGNVDLILQFLEDWKSNYPGSLINNWCRRAGPVFEFNVLWQPSILTTWPEHIQLILATDFQNYAKGERFQENMQAMLGEGVFNADGDMWKFHRSMARPFFTRDRISHFELFDRHCLQVIQIMKQRFKTSYAIDFQELMYRFTLDAASEFLFGTCLNVLKAGDLPFPHLAPDYTTKPTNPLAIEALNFSDAFLEAQNVISNHERAGPIWPLFEIWEDKATEPMKVLNAFVKPIVAEALRKRREKGVEKARLGQQGLDEKEIQDDETLLDHLVEKTQDPTILRDETVNILLAGRDTTAATLTFVFYALSIYPHILTKLRREILKTLGPNGRPTFENIKEMKYLRAVINETLRLYPVVPFNVRECLNDTTWPSPVPGEKPIFVAAGTKTPYSVMLMHRRTDLWGPDAEVFDPERFIDERLKKYLTPRPFIFLPFNAGPRICLGQQFAYNEMSFMIIRLLQNFSSFSLSEESFPPEFRPRPDWKLDAEIMGRPTRKSEERFFPKQSLTLYAGGGMWLKGVEVVDE